MAYQLLLADDSATMQRVVQITFANEDFQVTAVDNGQAAVATAKSMKPQLALVDVGMPGMDGYAVCQAIKADAETAQIPVVLLASNFQPIDEARAQSVGAAAHVMKPFETQALIDRVKTLLGAPVSAPIRSIPASTPAASAPAAAAHPATPAAPPAAQAPAAAGGFGAPGFGAPPRPQVAPTQVAAGSPPGLATGAPPPVRPAGASAATVAGQGSPFTPPLRAPQGSAPSPFSPGTPAGPPQRTAPPQFGQPPVAAGAPPVQARPVSPGGAPPPVARSPFAQPAGAPSPTARPAAAPPRSETSFGDMQIDIGENDMSTQPTHALGAAPARPTPPPAAASPFTSPLGGQVAQSRDPFGLGQAKPAGAPAPAPSASAGTAARAGGLPAELAGMNEDVIRAVAREVVERIAWEIMPELAETIVRQHLDKLLKEQGR